MTVSELIKELEKFPPDLTVIGYHNSNYSDKVELSRMKVAIEGDYLKWWDEFSEEQPTECLMLEFY